MNFLAHSHLSGDNDDILFGNFVADAIKGSDFKQYTNDIQIGIKLHRKIDFYTDHHPLFKNTLAQIRDPFGKYAGIAADIYYDHFLAKSWESHHDASLKNFTNHVYAVLKKNYLILPERTKRLLPFLITQNWLVGYADFDDLQLVFYGMDRRTKFKSGMSNAVEVLKDNYTGIRKDFEAFYPQLFDFSKLTLSEMKNEID